MAPIHLSLEDIAVHGGHEVLMKVDNNISLIVGDLERILYHQLSGLYYTPMTIVNDDSRVIKLETSLTDDARLIIYDNPMFIVQATDLIKSTY